MNLIEWLKTRWVVWVWSHTPNCAEMSKLASQGLDRQLPWSLRLQMRLHYLICCWCKRYRKQLQFLHRAAPSLNEEFAVFSPRGLSSDARQRILQTIQSVKGC
jgi:hypothetical protein